MTRRMLFMKLLGLLGTGALVRKALALGGGKECYTVKACSWQGAYWERIVGTNQLDAEHVAERVEYWWHDKHWKYDCYDQVLSTDSEALASGPVWIGDEDEAMFLASAKDMLRQGASGVIGRIKRSADTLKEPHGSI